jgi:hypothetical protein
MRWSTHFQKLSQEDPRCRTDVEVADAHVVYQTGSRWCGGCVLALLLLVAAVVMVVVVVFVAAFVARARTEL